MTAVCECPCAAKLDELQRELSKVKGRLHTLETIDDRVDDHDRKLDLLESDVREVKRTVHNMAAQVDRLTDASTAQGLSLERVERNTNRIVEILEPRSVIVAPEASRG